MDTGKNLLGRKNPSTATDLLCSLAGYKSRRTPPLVPAHQAQAPWMPGFQSTSTRTGKLTAEVAVRLAAARHHALALAPSVRPSPSHLLGPPQHRSRHHRSCVALTRDVASALAASHSRRSRASSRPAAGAERHQDRRPAPALAIGDERPVWISTRRDRNDKGRKKEWGLATNEEHGCQFYPINPNKPHPKRLLHFSL